MKVALVLHGDDPSPEDLNLLRACEAVVAADGGARALLRADMEPTVIVGDLDSLTGEDYEWAEARGVPIERHSADKDLTDGELALAKALELGATSILVLGGHGGRSAMFLANLKLLRQAHDQGIEAILVGRGESVRFVRAGSQLPLAGRTGHTLDVLGVGGPVKVKLTGTKWEGEFELTATSCQGVSNTITEDGATVDVLDGTALVIVERAEERKRL
ncbi:MAG: thiamine diphosphokinase [Thermoplasmatota archaeon]